MLVVRKKFLSLIATIGPHGAIKWKKARKFKSFVVRQLIQNMEEILEAGLYLGDFSGNAEGSH